MANRKLSGLADAGTLAGAEPIATVKGGQTLATTPDSIAAFALSAPATPAVSARARVEKLKRASAIALRNNPRVNGVMANPPGLLARGALPAGNTREYRLHDDGVLRAVYPFDICGGYPYFNPGNGHVGFPCLRLNATAGGNIDGSGRAAICWRVRFMTDAARPSVRLLGFSNYRFLVDDGSGNRYVAMTTFASQPQGGAQYIHLDFGSRSTTGRLVTVEGTFGAGMTGVSVAQTEHVWKPPQGDRVKIGVIGDSIAGSTGALWAGDGFAMVLGDMLGAHDCWQIAIGGTGYVVPPNANPSQWKYGAHSSDWTNFTDWDALVFSGGNNDYGYDPAQIQAAASDLLRVTRQALPRTPIVVIGPDAVFTGPDSTIVGVEHAIRDAANAPADPFIRFAPLVELPEGGAEIFGTGNAMAPNGTGNSDFLTGNTRENDPVHPGDPGHLYRGIFRAARVRAALAAM